MQLKEVMAAISWTFVILNVLVIGQTLAFSSRPKITIGKSYLRAENGETFLSQSDYLQHLKSQAQLPRGFSVGTTRFNFQPVEVVKTLPMNLTLVKTDNPTTSFAAVFTSNLFPGGPVIVGRDRMMNSESLQAVVVNNKISNVCPGGIGDRGAGDSDMICQHVADVLKLPSKNMVFPSSTGIIGWRLPVEAIKNAIPTAAANMQSESAYPAALGITTTDRYPKVRTISSKDKRWSILAFAKGAGMIEPNMATMLAYILTDLNIPREKLQHMLSTAVKDTFNAISVDGDQSTSDTCLLLSSQMIPTTSSADEEEFQSALNSLCRKLAADIVRNGEGTQHVVRVTVTGTPNDIIARDLGRFIVNSNLVKCAISGSDPNVGRIVGAIGSYLGSASVTAAIGVTAANELTKDLKVTLGGVVIFSNGAFQLNPEKEMQLSDYMLDAQLFPSDVPEHDRNYPPHDKYVDIEVVVAGGNGNGSCVVIGSDLTKEYVEVNADYRS
eukprot:gene3017-5911_t